MIAATKRKSQHIAGLFIFAFGIAAGIGLLSLLI